MARGESFTLLREAYENLTKAGSTSLQAAYRFGAVCDALSGMYTQRSLAQAVGVSTSTINCYLRLFRRYPTEHALLHMAEELGTYDVSKLNGSVPSAPVHYVLHCTNCGGTEFVKEREPEAAVLAQVRVTA